jgi:hypothetical protein
MKTIALDAPTFGFVVGTRVMLAVGIGLLLAHKLTDAQRRALGAALVGVGAVSTIPALMAVRRSLTGSNGTGSHVERDERLIGATRFPRKGDDNFD